MLAATSEFFQSTEYVYNRTRTDKHHSGAANDAGYPAAYVCDENMVDSSPYIHTANDALSTLDFDHLYQHVRLTVGFLVEGSYF